MKRSLSALFALLSMGVMLSSFGDAGQTLTPPLQTPRLNLYAEFTENTRCPVFNADAKVSVWLKVEGRRIIDETLLWAQLDMKGVALAKGSIPVPKGNAAWEQVLDLPKTKSGYFELSLKLDKTGVTLPQMGSRAAGLLAYAVLPSLEPLKIEYVDQSRFGGMGTNFIVSGEYLKGDYVSPIYPLVGMKWCYRSRRPGEMLKNSIDELKTISDPAKMLEAGKGSCERAAGLCLLSDFHSLPVWLMKYPDAGKANDVNPTQEGQAYPPNDYAAYSKIIGALAAEQALNRKVNFPFQKRNYYFIHWEPDWHWKGSDEDFIKMYEVAYKAVHENDPDALLLGANYGVLATGNKHFERLFAKGLGQWLDGIVTHGYYIPEVQDPESGNLIVDMRKLMDMKRRYLKPDAFVINSEWGTNYGSVPALKYHPALLGEASRFMRGHIIALGEGCDTTMFFYTADMDEHGWGLFYNLNAPNPGCGATNVAPKPVMATATFATRLLEGTKNLCVMDFLGENVWGYAFDRAGVPVVALWSLDDVEREIDVPAGVKELTAFDPVGNPSTIKCHDGIAKLRIGAIPCYLMGLSKAALPVAQEKVAGGFPGDPLKLDASLKYTMKRGEYSAELGEGSSPAIPRSAPAGRGLLLAYDPVDGHLVSSSLVDVKPAVSLQLTGSTVKVSNLTGQELKGSLYVGKSGSDPVFKRQAVIPVFGSAEFVLETDKLGLDSASDVDIAMKFVDANGSASLGKAALRSSYVARKVTRPPAMDGTAGDWQLELFKTVTGPENVFGGDADLSFRLAMQYDERNLYCVFKVRDQSHVQERNDADSWNEDSVQLAIALHPENGDWKLFHKFCFAKSSKTGAVMEYRHNGTAELPAGKLSQTDAPCAITRSGDETIYTITIPWASLEKSLKSFPSEKRIGVGVYVNDVDMVDGQKTKRKSMEAFGGMGYTLSKDFGTVSLE